MGNGPFFPRFIKEKALKNVPLCTSSEVETTNLRFFERNLANRGRRTLSPPVLRSIPGAFFLLISVLPGADRAYGRGVRRDAAVYGKKSETAGKKGG